MITLNHPAHASEGYKNDHASMQTLPRRMLTSLELSEIPALLRDASRRRGSRGLILFELSIERFASDPKQSRSLRLVTSGDRERVSD